MKRCAAWLVGLTLGVLGINLIGLFRPIPMLAQPVPAPAVRYVTSAPTGGCGNSYITVKKTDGTMAGCVNSVWASIGGSGTSSAPAFTTVTYSATPTFTVSANSSIQTFKITLTGNVTSSTLTTTNATTGQAISFIICQDGSGAHTFVAPANLTGGVGTINRTLSTCSKQDFRFDGTNAVAIGAMYTDGTATNGVGASAASPVSLVGGSDNVIEFDTQSGSVVSWDTSGGLLHSTSSNKGDFVASSSGRWSLTCSMQWTGTSTGALVMYIAGAGSGAVSTEIVPAGATTGGTTTGVFSLSAGDIVRCRAFNQGTTSSAYIAFATFYKLVLN